MSNVVFRTNIDAYNEKHCFPTHFSEVPRKGDFVEVLSDFHSYFRMKKLPIRLEVVSVNWREQEPVDRESNFSRSTTIATCELWYNVTDKQLAEMSGAKTL